MDRQYFVVDAFATERYSGNPAAIVLDAEGIDAEAMQLIASEFNLSETTFVFPSDVEDALVRFRWFTPTTEVAMCGHATIAGIHALVESDAIRLKGGAQSTKVCIETLSGVLNAFVEEMPGDIDGRMIWLDLPTPVLSDYRINETALAAALNLPVDAFDPDLSPAMTQDRDVIVFVKDVQALNGARPDHTRLGDLHTRERVRGLCLATIGTLTPSIHVQSRFFAPTAGINEDPVTGSVHGPLAAYLLRRNLAPMHDGIAGLRCLQGKAGGKCGTIYALASIESDGACAVRIGGHAVTTMRGTLLA